MLKSEFPKAGRLRPKDRVIYLKNAIISILRNKRRSVSMIAGLILGISILSGILLYSTVVMNNVYDTVIEGSPYEVRMDFKGSFEDLELEGFRQQFVDSPKILDAQLLYGNARTVIERRAGGYQMSTLAYLEASILVEYSNQSFSSSEGILYSESFMSSTIGSRFKDKLLSGKEAEIYSNSSPYYHGVFLSENLAEKARVQQGNVLRSVTLTITQQDPESLFNRITLSTVTIANMTIAGIVSSDIGASAGLFSEALTFGSSGTIYLPEEILQTQDNTSFLADLRANEMKYAVIKINEEEFDLANPEKVNSQINQLINEFEKDNEFMIGTNLVEGQLLPFQTLSFFIFIFDGILTIPVAILSLYLLSFGIDLSLHERKYQVGILKVQGASPRQIKRKIMTETLILALVGLIAGYIIAIFAAWGIGTAKGFMKWDWEYAIKELPEFFVFDEVAFYVVGGFIILILFFMTNGKINNFIQMEVIESVRRTETKKQNFLRRNNLDLIFFGIGILVLTLVLADELFGYHVDLGFVGGLLALLGPPMFWIGGAATVARVASWLPSKSDAFVKKLGFMKDIAILVKGNVFRKTGDVPRLSLIIALIVSFSVLAAVQGTTGEVHKERLTTFSVGADMVVTTSLNFSTTVIPMIQSSSNDITSVMAITTTSGMIFNDPVDLYTVDSELYHQVGKWQVDSVPDSNPKKLIESLKSAPTTGVLMGKNVLIEKALSIGEEFTLDILTYHWNGSFVNYDFVPVNVTVKGKFDHCPNGIGPNSIIVDHSLVNSISNLTALSGIIDELPGYMVNLIPDILKGSISSIENDSKAVLASKYLVSVKSGANVEQVKRLIASTENTWVISVTTLEGEIAKANEMQNVDYGIPGLLTADFVISLVAATLATFIFM
ncbi:MAG: FtsX-like permease family protein, partial [Candidatus Hodarchaeales archaeon]